MDHELLRLRADLERGRRCDCRVVSDSMAPVIPVGEVIAVERFPEGGPRALRRYDIVLFEVGDQVICHYLWSRNERPEPDGSFLYVTRSLRGAEDLPTPEARMIGRVVSHRVPWYYRLAPLRLLLGQRLKRGIMS